jgi:predicted RNA-binding Zn ribbon-like protein
MVDGRTERDGAPSGDGRELALAIVNTLTRGEDRLHRPDEVRRWVEAAGLLVSERDRALARSPSTLRVLRDEARALRSALRRLFEAHGEGTAPPAAALHAVNRVLALSRRSASLVSSADGFSIQERERGPRPLSLLAPVALGGSRLLIDVAHGRLRRCDADGCGTWFVDTSKGGRRRWCSMALCGNRAKAARHRRREALGPRP